MRKPQLTPREFLKARRPEKFSDSDTAEVTDLDRGLLEYHLQSLTSRSQHTEFENFARALIKVEICPNILPQTGPTGGGDSKVDSETYPVSDSLALAWFSGIGREASSERWAFAFSAKLQWQSKLKADIAKIVGTDRGYKRAFFVTNQFVPDKKRAELEDSLSRIHGLDVRILDRTWILDAVFDHKREEIAIKELGASAQIRRETRLGPLDSQREAELKRLEERISESAAKEHLDSVTVDDCIAAAVLSRELERPRIETLGRFERAASLADKCGTQHQKVVCAYDRAWTTYFWFEDFPTFVELYAIVEAQATNSPNIYDLELLTNLWMLLHGGVQDVATIESHTDLLLSLLARIASNEETPTAALEARSLLTKIELSRAVKGRQPYDTQLRELSDIVNKAESLSGFPLLPLAYTYMELGEFLGTVPEYDVLYAELVEIVARRKGEVEAARLLVQRADQQLDADKPVDAIQTIGKALHRLAKDESRNIFTHALYLCACAYERLGLLWAARGTLLMAASISMSDFWRYEDVTRVQATCLSRLKWVELQIGRIPEILSWHEFDSIIRRILLAQGDDKRLLQQGSIEFDAIFGILFLKTNFSDLKKLSRLPDSLSFLELHTSSIALLYALGHESEYKSTFVKPSEGEDDLSFFVKWRDQPASADLPSAPCCCDQITVELRTNVVGCEISLSTPNGPPFVEVGESFLAAIESTLATGLVRKIVAREPRFTATIERSETCKVPFEFTVADDSGYVHLSIACREFDPDRLSIDQRVELNERLAEMVISSVGHIVIADESQLHELLRDDLAVPRAIGFSGSFQVLGNILGPKRGRYLSSWIDENKPAYDLQREKPWDAEFPPDNSSRKPLNFAHAEKETPSETEVTNRFQTARHSKIRTVSLIREPLWNKARWQGMGVVATPNFPPILALVFRESEPANRIFSLWETEIGSIDENEELRVSIVRHFDRKNPTHYRVVIGSNMEIMSLAEGEAFFAMSRIHTMTPNTSSNLDAFLEAYNSFGEYLLAPAVIDRSGQYPERIGDFQLLKRKLFVREAWEIGVNDFDVAGILPDDAPFIPEGVESPPVAELLEWKKRKEDEYRVRQREVEAIATLEKSRKEKEKKDKEKRKRQIAKNSRRKNQSK